LILEEEFTLSWTKTIEKIEIYDGQGKLITSVENINNNKVDLSSSKLSSGTYISRVYGAGDGLHNFTKSLAQHNKNARDIQNWLDSIGK